MGLWGLLFFLFSLFESDLFPAHCLNRETFNPARLAGRRLDITSFGREQFGLSEFRTFDLTVAVRSGAVELSSFGTGSYRENRFALGYGWAIGGKLAAGAQIGLLDCRVRGSADRFVYRLKFGGLGRFGPLTGAAWLNNMNRPRLGAVDRLPLSYGIDLGYAPSKRFLPYFAVLGAEGIIPFFKFGFDLDPGPWARLTAGISTDPVQAEYGIRIRCRSIYILYSGSTHSQLGLTHGLGIQIAAP
jgi:hypothetical protein